jgi:hypothetical protein
VIGVHAPELEFEKNVDNVRQAAREMRVDYPIAIDNEHAIWRALKNAYWPALYFVDAQGRTRHHHFGEGDYKQSEKTNRCARRGDSAGQGQRWRPDVPAAALAHGKSRVAAAPSAGAR